MQQKPWEEYAAQSNKKPWEEYGTSAVPPVPKSEPKKSLLDEVGGYLPSRRTTLQAGGAAIGGALGSTGGPLGVVAGGSLGAGAGESLDELISRFTGGDNTPPTSGDALGRIGNAATMGALQEAMGMGIPAAAGKTAQFLYRNTLKPSTTLAPEAVSAMVNTGLREGIPVSAKGLQKLNRNVGTLSQGVDDILARGGPTIDPHLAAMRVNPVVNQFKQQVNPVDDINAVLKAKDEFLQQYPNPMSAPEAQALKTGTYKQLGNKAYGELKTSSVEGQKALARGLKEEIEAEYPDVIPLNQQMGDLLDLRTPLERAINRIGNRNMIGIDAPLAAGALEGLTGSRGLSAVGALAKTLPGSRTGIYLNRLAKHLGAAKYAVPAAAASTRSR